MIPCRKNETKFSKFGACIWSPEQFLQIRSKTTEKITKIAISYCIKKWFAPSGPDFYAIFKMGHQISVPQIQTKLFSIL